MPSPAQNPMACPKALDDVDLFGTGAQEHWYAAYDILHREAPVLRIAGEGLTPDKDAFILTKHEDISRVVKDWDRFPPTLSLLVRQIEAAGKLPQEMPDLDAMIISICSLRPTPELWRAHRQELTDPWVGPGAKRHENMITDHGCSVCLAGELVNQYSAVAPRVLFAARRDHPSHFTGCASAGKVCTLHDDT